MKIFTDIYTSYRFECRKPEAMIYEKALKASNLTPHEVLFIDDLEENISSAKEVGIHAEHCFNSSEQMKEILRKYCLVK